jgi:soluble lytic murein transglycosylase
MNRKRGVLLVLIVFLTGALLLLRPGSPAPAPSGGDASDAAREQGVGPAAVARAAVLREAEELLKAGRPWRAALLMRDFRERHPELSPAGVLLAARAEAGWGGWDQVRALLEPQAWLVEEAGGEGLFLLARSLEEDSLYARAAATYRLFLQGNAPPADSLRTIAQLRAGLALLRSGETGSGATMLAEVARHGPSLGAWADLLAAEALASRGDTAGVRRRLAALDGRTFEHRARSARVAAFAAASDHPAAFRLATRYAGSASRAAERAEFLLAAARAALLSDDARAARTHLRAALTAAPRTRAAFEAARELERLGDPAPAEQLELARVFAAHGQNRRAADLYRAWLATATGSLAQRNEVRYSLGRALFDAGANAEAEAVLQEMIASGLTAEALYLLGRAQYRAGKQGAARDTYLQVAARFPGSQPGAEALYLVADLHHEGGEPTRARPIYRRVADDFPGSDRAGLALMRLGGMAFLERDFTAAGRFFEEYRTRYPRGQLWQQATYWQGRALEAAGRGEEANSLYRQARARAEISYYALQAAERLNQAYWPIAMGPEPAADPAAARRVAGWMRTVDLLRDAGLHEEADAEAQRLVGLLAGDRQLGYALAEALNERGYTVRGIRLGLQLQSGEGRPNPRLLRILYPFPYRDIIEAEARELGLDPLLSASLIRQESMFSARISSPVGARGLMQVMPTTGRSVAVGLGISRWNDELLFQPEINVHLGTRYLGEQFRAYGGSLPAVFSAYNAGPHRVEAWRRFPEFGDQELFTERIPFRETRDYVKILTRNYALYQGLYAERP